MVPPRSDSVEIQDPRWQRTRKALTQAVLELAAELPIHRVSVRAVADRAGVDRTTMYHHAETPEALLRDALLKELHAVFDTFRSEIITPNGNWTNTLDQGVRLTLEHVASRREIYRTNLHDGPVNLLHNVLAVFLTDTVRVLLADGKYPLPPGTQLTEADEDFAATSLGYATVGAITSWVARPDPLDTDEFMREYHLFFPTWVTGITPDSV